MKLRLPSGMTRLRQLWFRVAPWLLAAAGGALVTLWWDKSWRDDLLLQNKSLAQQFEQLRQQQGHTQRELAKSSADLAVAHARDQENRKALAELTSQLATAQQELTFFRNVVDPKGSGQGVVIEALEIQPLPAANSYLFRMVMVQYGSHDKASPVKVSMVLEGTADAQPRTLDLLELAGIEKKSRTLPLRYFQVLEGTVVLPAEFQPSRIEVTAQRNAGRRAPATRAARSFAWQELIGDGSLEAETAVPFDDTTEQQAELSEEADL